MLIDESNAAIIFWFNFFCLCRGCRTCAACLRPSLPPPPGPSRRTTRIVVRYSTSPWCPWPRLACSAPTGTSTKVLSQLWGTMGHTSFMEAHSCHEYGRCQRALILLSTSSLLWSQVVMNRIITWLALDQAWTWIEIRLIIDCLWITRGLGSKLDYLWIEFGLGLTLD